MDSKNENVAVRAAETLLDRGYGRPMQGVEVIEKEKTQIAKQISIMFVKPGERISSTPQRLTSSPLSLDARIGTPQQKHSSEATVHDVRRLTVQMFSSDNLNGGAPCPAKYQDMDNKPAREDDVQDVVTVGESPSIVNAITLPMRRNRLRRSQAGLAGIHHTTGPRWLPHRPAICFPMAKSWYLSDCDTGMNLLAR
jgi:hypothetical protein